MPGCGTLAPVVADRRLHPDAVPARSASASSGKLHGKPQYYDTYWYSSSPITDRWIRPELMANASGFYGNMLKVKRFWDAELKAEGMMEVQLPATITTNGTWLAHQSVRQLRHSCGTVSRAFLGPVRSHARRVACSIACPCLLDADWCLHSDVVANFIKFMCLQVFSFVRSMISRDNTWHPRYGVIPGYGITLQDGFQDTFTSTATAALEWGSIPCANFDIILDHLSRRPALHHPSHRPQAP